MTQLLPSPRDWLIDRDPPRTHAMDESMEDLCMSMEKMLRRGERYQAPHTLRYISLKETWYWEATPAGTVRYLDASCLLFGESQKFLEFIDYTARRSDNNQGYYSAVRHSGDILDEEERMGQHTIDVDLAELSPAVKEMFITTSAFAPSKLSDIQSPSVTMEDRETGASLCAYELEEPAQASLYTSVVMCRIYRSAECESRWEVEALGHLGQGAAGQYEPIVQYITHCLPLANSLATWRF